MNVSEYAIRNRAFTWILMFGLIIFGGLAYTGMGISLHPDIDLPVANVSISYPGTPPEVIEKTVVEPLESSFATVPGIKSMRSNLSTGSAYISIEFELGQDIDTAVRDLQARLSWVQPLLPRSLPPPLISRESSTGGPILYITLEAADRSYRELMLLIKERVQDGLASVEGVAEVVVFGYTDPVLRVDIDPAKLKAMELSPDDVIQAIQQEHSELPAGHVMHKGKDRAIRVLAEATTVDDFKNITLGRRGGEPVFTRIKLGDVAHVYEGTDEIRRIQRMDGHEAITIGIIKQQRANAIDVSGDVKRRLEEINKFLPERTALKVSFDTTEFISEAVHDLLVTLLLSAALTSVICWIFLGSWSATANVLLAIPTSIVGTFIVLKLLNFSLNTFTILGLSLAIGIVVDDAIIVVENIFRHRSTNADPVRSAILGSKQITLAILATTTAVVAIFLPIAFIQGLVGEFVFQFAVTISVAIILSMVESLTIAPMRISTFKGTTQRTTRLGKSFDKAMDLLAGAYARSLHWVLRYRYPFLIGVALLFSLSLYLLHVVRTEFTPPVDEARAHIFVDAPQGSALEYTDEKVKKLEGELAKLPFVSHYFSSVGGLGGGGQGNSGMIIAIFKKYKEREINSETGSPYTMAEIEEMLRGAVNKVPELTGFIRTNFSSDFGVGGGQPIEFMIKGPDAKNLRELTKQLIDRLSDTGVFVDLYAGDIDSNLELHVLPDREACARHGVDIGTLASTLSTLMSGTRAAYYSQASWRHPVLVRLPESAMKSTDVINSIDVRNNRGEMVPLRPLIKFVEAEGPLSIFRENRQRAIAVSSGLQSGVSQGRALTRLHEEASKFLPAGYYIDITGSSKNFTDTFQGFMVAFGVGIVISYLILGIQFKSLTDPVAILMTMPFSISGALVSLWLTDQSINIYSMIGNLLLMGIAKKNGILIIEFCKQLHEQGHSIQKSIIEAGRLRLRPILMTSLATAAGALPAAISFGPGSETRVPMAVAIVGGVILSTPLTLYLVPVIYSFVGKKESYSRSKASTLELAPV